MIIKGKKNKSSFIWRKLVWPILIAGLGIFIFLSQKSNFSSKKEIGIACDAEKIADGRFISEDYTINNGHTQSDEKSLSGTYSSKVDKDNRYGMSLKLDEPQKGVRYIATIKRWTDDPKKSAFAIKASPSKKYTIQTSNATSKNADGWEELKLELYIPEYADVNEISIFPYQVGNQGMSYFDDMKVTIMPIGLDADATLDKLHIYLDAKALDKINTKRNNAIRKGILQTGDNDWVKARLTENDSLEHEVKLRLKGDWTDHLKGDYWSYRIKMPSDKSWNRMQTFSLQDPKTRYFLDEWIYHRALEQEDVITPRFGFIELKQNTKSPVLYAYEEHFEKQIVEYKNRREGVILKFSEDYLWNQRLKNKDEERGDTYENAMNKSTIETFGSKKVIKDLKKKEQFEHGQDLLYAFKHRTLPVSEIFEMEKLAKYYALTDIFNANHGMIWHNQRFYYNPIIRKLEPIGFDGFTETGAFRMYNWLFFGEYKSAEAGTEWSDFYQNIYRDSIFNAYYIPAMMEYSSPEFINSLLENASSETAVYEAELKKYQYPDYKFDGNRFVKRANLIRKNITPVDEDAMKAYSTGNELFITNNHPLPIQYLGASNIKDYTPSEAIATRLVNSNQRLGQPKFTKLKANKGAKYIHYKMLGSDEVYYSTIKKWRNAETPILRYSTYSKMEIPLTEGAYTKKGNEIIIHAGSHEITSPIIIPESYAVTIEAGTQMDFKNKAYFLCHNTVHLKGRKDVPILITSSDKSSQGFIVMGGKEISTVSYASFTNLNTIEEREWQLTGAVTFYESDVEMTAVTISDNLCEDALNIIRSTFNIKKLNINSTFGDGFDCDFCKGTISDSRLYDTGNDGLDFSGSNITILDVVMDNVGDKGISGGEESTLKVKNVYINQAIIGIASKDLSVLTLNNVNLTNCDDGFAAYRKKPEFGGATIDVKSYTAENVKRLINKDEESKIKMPK